MLDLDPFALNGTNLEMKEGFDVFEYWAARRRKEEKYKKRVRRYVRKTVLPLILGGSKDAYLYEAGTSGVDDNVAKCYEDMEFMDELNN